MPVEFWSLVKHGRNMPFKSADLFKSFDDRYNAWLGRAQTGMLWRSCVSW